MTTIAGKHAVITGAGSGIGQLVASRMAAKGAAVTMLDINEDNLQRTAEQIRGASGARDPARPRSATTVRC
jgi:NADP-dependent 3-hydroxy acid dehydrogenase YdfG